MPKEIPDKLDEKKVEQQQIKYFDDQEAMDTHFRNLEGGIEDGIKKAKKCFNGEYEDWRAFFEFIEERFENKMPPVEIEAIRKEQFPDEDWRAFFEFIEEQFENKIPLAEIKEKGEEQFPNYMECTRILYPALHAKYAQMPHEREVYIVKNKATDK